MKKNPLNEPIARGGESIYASIVRNRSGIDSGCIDYGLRTFEVQKLGEGDKQDIADTAFALYESICQATGKCAERDTFRTQLEEAKKRVVELEEERGYLLHDFASTLINLAPKDLLDKTVKECLEERSRDV